jgi:glycine dehydrogenase subunit 1
VAAQGIELVSQAVGEDGLVDVAVLTADDREADEEPYAAVIVQQPNFYGLLENVDRITNWAKSKQALVIAVVNPLSLALLKPPGEWGQTGVDIVVGDGQPLGVPMASGGPSFGFMCCRQKIVRQMPGRIIGGTEDLDGKPGFTLTLQAREQHIRRAKATSNICTNQGLLVTAATIHMSLMGGEGLKRTAAMCNAKMTELSKRLVELPGVEIAFAGPYFHERVFRLPKPAQGVVEAAADHGVLAGIALGRYYPDLENCLLVCATEKRTEAEFDKFVSVLEQVL